MLLSISDLHLHIHHLGKRTSVLHGVNLQVAAGEMVGLVGETGSGKTLTALSTIRLLPPGSAISRGEILFEGADLTRADDRTIQQIRGRAISTIFQQPRAALNPTRRVLDQLADRLVDLKGMTLRHAREAAIDLLAQVGMPDPKVRGNEYPHQLSGGMCQRVMIALAIAAGPKLLLADEPTTGLDVTLQRQILQLLTDLAVRNRMAVLLITHDLAMVAESCQRVAVMYAGEVVEVGDTREVLHTPQHPYTKGLVTSIVTLETGQRPQAIPGQPPRFESTPHFCPFVTRCSQAEDRCRATRPALKLVGTRREVACHLV